MHVSLAGAGAPVLAYSEGAYPPGTNHSDCESGSKVVKERGLKRSLTRIASPAKSDKREKLDSIPQDAQDPNGTPGRGSETPVFSPVAPAPATPVNEAAPATPTPRAPASMAPPPVPNGPEPKDALFWKFFG